jgi:general secretion pathway protein I
MDGPRNEQGFTLIEVLVALTIIAVAMAAALRVAGLMTQSAELLRAKSIAMQAALSRLSELRLEERFSPGKEVFECNQGRLRLRCEQMINPSTNDRLFRVTVQVLDNSREAPPLASLETLLGRSSLKTGP